LQGELQARRQKYGKNSIEDHKRNPFLQYMSYFANPLAYAMEIAALISAIVFDWLDFGLIIGLLFANATIGYWEEAVSFSFLLYLFYSINYIVCI
jgi:H+-transporting ATPase